MIGVPQPTGDNGIPFGFVLFFFSVRFQEGYKFPLKLHGNKGEGSAKRRKVKVKSERKFSIINSSAEALESQRSVVQLDMKCEVSSFTALML